MKAGPKYRNIELIGLSHLSSLLSWGSLCTDQLGSLPRGFQGCRQPIKYLRLGATVNVAPTLCKLTP